MNSITQKIKKYQRYERLRMDHMFRGSNVIVDDPPGTQELGAQICEDCKKTYSATTTSCPHCTK